MPLVRIDLRQGKSPQRIAKRCATRVYCAMRETFNVPENDRFMIVNEHECRRISSHAVSYLGYHYTPTHLVIIQDNGQRHPHGGAEK